MFADDSTFILSHSNLNTLIDLANQEFAKVAQWMRANRLKLHPDKTKFMIFCTHKKPLNLDICKIYLNDNDIDCREQNPNLISELECLNTRNDPSVRFLGIFLDPHLTFKPHISHVARKVSQGLFILRKVKNMLPLSSMIKLYYSMINCHLYYGLPVYGCADISNLKKLVLLQKKAIRIITNSNYNAHTDPLFKKTNILKFTDMVQFLKIDFMHSFCYGLLPNSFDDIWTQICEIDDNLNLNLRNYLHFRIPFTRLHFSERLPLHSFPRSWNSMETDLLCESSKKKFKKNLKALFMNNLPDVVNCSNPYCSSCYSNEIFDHQH